MMICFDLRALYVDVFAAARDGRPLTLYALLTCMSDADRDAILKHRIVYKYQIVTPYLIAIRGGHITTAAVIRDFFPTNMAKSGKLTEPGKIYIIHIYIATI